MGDLVLKFRGTDYVLPESRAFEAGEAIEEIATLSEVYSWAKRPQFFKMARCFAALLRLCGAKVKDREVHAEMIEGFKAGDPTLIHLGALTALLDILMDGAPASEGGSADDAPGKPSAAS